AGTGSRLEHWKRLAAEAGLSDRLRFLGFTGEVRRVLAASDILVSPVHYESYGLNVQEALARGLPAIVSESAGVAERYTGQDRELLLADPDDAEALAGMLRRWSGEMDRWRARFRTVALSVQKESWNGMAETMANLIEVAYESADDFRQLPVSS
ncbi:MAG: glycosyltransferase family 4 protein, partial [Acidobacteriota bacterium]